MKGYAAILVAVLLAGSALAARGATAQQAGTIRITGPANGATVSGTVELAVDIQGVTVKPAAEGDPAAFHYHALVDVDPATVLQAGQPIPTGQANIVHTADRVLPLPNLPAGQHTVVVVLTRTDHVPLSPAVQDRVTFTVSAAPAAAGQTPATAPRVGTGGGIGADTDASVSLLLALAAVLALGTGVVLVRARGRT